MTIYTIIPRVGLQSAYSALNRIYGEGELLLEEQLDGTYKLKVGNGTTPYNALQYLGGAAGGSPLSHASTHSASGSDAIKLDALAAPDDVTTLNATVSAHGLLRKLSGSTSQYLRGDGAWAVVSGAQVFSVLTDFGAVGDGVTNNTAAITAAITSNRLIYVPPGTYNLNEITITGATSSCIFGAAQGFASQFRLISGSACFTLSNSANIEFVNIAFLPASNISNATAITVTNASNVQVRSCLIYNFNGPGIRMSGTVSQQLSGCIVRDCLFLSNGLNGTSAQLDSYYSNDFSYSGNQFGSFLPATIFPSMGMQLDFSSNGLLLDNLIWECIRGLNITNSKYNRIVANRIELSKQAGVVMASCSDTIFTNNWINDSSTSAIGSYDACSFTGNDNNVISNNIVHAWAYPTRNHRTSFVFSGVTNSTISSNKSKYAATAHATLSAGSSGNGFDGDVSFTSASAVNNGQTVYLANAGSSSSSASMLLVSRRVAMQLWVAVDVAPGAGQSITATLMVDQIATSLACTISGTSFSSEIFASHEISAGSGISVRLAYSATAASSIPRCRLHMMCV